MLTEGMKVLEKVAFENSQSGSYVNKAKDTVFSKIFRGPKPVWQCDFIQPLQHWKGFWSANNSKGSTHQSEGFQG